MVDTTLLPNLSQSASFVSRHSSFWEKSRETKLTRLINQLPKISEVPFSYNKYDQERINYDKNRFNGAYTVI